MAFDIILAPETVADLRRLRANLRAAVHDAERPVSRYDEWDRGILAIVAKSEAQAWLAQFGLPR
jgi:hypothetical protein